MSDHGHTTDAPQMRDPDSKLVAQIGAVSAVLVLATVFAIQGLYFYFQHLENEHKAELYGPDVAGKTEQQSALTKTEVIDAKTGRLQLQVNVARTIIQEELASEQDDH